MRPIVVSITAVGPVGTGEITMPSTRLGASPWEFETRADCAVAAIPVKSGKVSHTQMAAFIQRARLLKVIVMIVHYANSNPTKGRVTGNTEVSWEPGRVVVSVLSTIRQ